MVRRPRQADYFNDSDEEIEELEAEQAEREDDAYELWRDRKDHPPPAASQDDSVEEPPADAPGDPLGYEDDDFADGV